LVWHTRSSNREEIGTLEDMVDINSIGIIITTSQAIIPTGLGDGLLGHGIIGAIGVAGGGKSSNNFFKGFYFCRFVDYFSAKLH